LSLPLASNGTGNVSQVSAWNDIQRWRNITNNSKVELLSYWETLWRELQDSQSAAFVEPLEVYRCADIENCIGTQSGIGNHTDCVCYTQ
jgi:hypothetical protein